MGLTAPVTPALVPADFAFTVNFSYAVDPIITLLANLQLDLGLALIMQMS